MYLETPLIDNKDCSYVILMVKLRFAVEQAIIKGLIRLEKPVSCHLYLFVKDYTGCSC
jgi:hypothetical protein